MDTVTDIAEPQTATPPTADTEGLAGLLTAAVDQARAAIIEFSGPTVGEYLGVTYDDTSAATHRFLAEVTGYRGWQWAVVVAAYPGAQHATVSEVVLVPGPTALLAPPWVPWEERVRPGDLSPGDLLAPPADDPRLVPGYLLSGDAEADEVAAEIGLGRKRVLSAWGRDDAAQRWHDGDYGPDSAMARSTRRVCRDCGYLLPLAGSLGAMFGVCSNGMAADGHVVDFTYGCGAHSDTPAPAGTGSPLYEPYDDGVLEVNENPVAAAVETLEPAVAAEAATETVEAPEAESVETADTVATSEFAEAPQVEALEVVPEATEPVEAAVEASEPEVVEAPDSVEAPAAVEVVDNAESVGPVQAPSDSDADHPHEEPRES